MHPAEAVAQGYRYPAPGSHEALAAAVAEADAVPHMDDFVDAVGILSLAEWEELHTVTLDLSPQFVPYVGHVVWGENYRRGAFMADLKADMERHDVDLGGELPDHIEPVLRYLAQVPGPLEDLTEVVGGAVTTMRETLRKAESESPYLLLLDATTAVVEEHSILTIRPRSAAS